MFKSSLQKKADFIFYQLMAIELIFFVLLLFLSLNLYRQLFLIGKSLLNKLELVCGCNNHFSFLNHPLIFIFSSLMGLGVFLFFCFAVIKTIKSKNSTDKFVKIYLKDKKQNLSLKLKKVARLLELENLIIEVNQEKPIIFCFGLIKPKICVSSGLIKRLAVKELTAVLLHEKQHLTTREPLKIFLVKITAKILFFIPGLKVLAKQYLIFSELIADERATNGLQNKTPLVRALSKVISWEKQLAIKNNLAISLFSAVTGERVNRLIDNKYIPKFKVSAVKLGLGIIFTIVFSFIFFDLLFFSGEAAGISYDVNSCQLASPDLVYHCQSAKESVCSVSYNSVSHECGQYKVNSMIVDN